MIELPAPDVAVLSRRAEIAAALKRIVPDGFKSGSEVVLKGRLNQQTGFSVEPGGVMAKCPSKYVAGPPVPGTKS